MTVKIMNEDEFLNFINTFHKFLNRFKEVPEHSLTEADYEFLPTNKEEFLQIVNDAPLNILKGLGFKKWMDAEKARHINPLSMELKPIKENFDIWLFPESFTNIIPIGYECIDTLGENVIYSKDDAEPLMGSLPYGIKKEHNKDEPNQLYNEFSEFMEQAFK